MLKYAVVFAASVFYSFCNAQPFAKSFEEIERLQITAPRPLLVLITADWCTYCKALQQTTLKNPEVIALLQRDYYFAVLNGEEKRDIHFRGKTFRYRPTGPSTGTHELAEALAMMDGKVSYPTITLLSPENEIVYQMTGFLPARRLLPLLQRAK